MPFASRVGGRRIPRRWSLCLVSIRSVTWIGLLPVCPTFPSRPVAPRRSCRWTYRSGDHYVLHADLPGIDPGSIDIGIDNNTLTIKAERTARSEDGVQWIASERFTGSFLRQLSLGDGIDSAAISASYENGVLTVTIPVADKAKPRKVQISTPDRQVVEQPAPAVTAS